MDKKKKMVFLFLALLIVLIIILALVIPTNEEKIYAFVQNDQYSEALEYIESNQIKVLDKNAKTEEVKTLLFEKFSTLSEKLLIDDNCYEMCKHAYALGKQLFFDEMLLSDSAKKLNKSIAMFDDITEVEKFANSKNYTKLLNAITTSIHKNDNTYKVEVEKVLSNLDKDEVYSIVEKDIEGSLKSEKFAEIPNFIKYENELINVCIKTEQIKNLSNKIDVSNKNKTCIASGCKNLKSSGAQYCSNHLCNESGCKNYASKSYCSAHTCVASGCDSGKKSGSSYCYSHTCSESDCNRYTSNVYCSAHECVKSGCDNGRSSGSSYCYSHQPSSSSTSYSVSGGTCYWCKGTGSVKYYFGDGYYDYEYGRCGSCLGTGQSRN